MLPKGGDAFDEARKGEESYQTQLSAKNLTYLQISGG